MKKIIYILLIPVLLVTACGEFDDMNIDPKSPTSADPGFLFASATKTLFDWKSTSNINYNVMRLAAQYWSQVTYTNESRYDWTGRQIADQMWLELYSRVLADLDEARRLNEGNADPVQKANMDAQITVLEVFTYQLLVDAHGDVPYTEALNAIEDASPAYDDAAEIYSAITDSLDAAIGKMDASGTAFGAQDLIYAGDVASWIKLANSLKMKLAIRISDVDETKAATMIAEAQAGAFTSNDDNAKMAYENDVVTGNPLYQQLVVSGRTDYCGSEKLVEVMNAVDDPRLDYYFELPEESSTHIGLEYGKLAGSDYTIFSTVGSMIKDPEFPGILMTYAEVEFILAEAAERGFAGVTGTAASHYNKAVTASITDWGGTAADASTYLAQAGVAYGSSNMNKIAEQKWIALYAQADEGYAEWRRLDYPDLYLPEEIDAIPVRYEYPFNEGDINASSYEAAVAKMGGDTQDIKIFWDVN